MGKLLTIGLCAISVVGLIACGNNDIDKNKDANNDKN